MTSFGPWFPSPQEYDLAPELGVLAILDDVLQGVSMIMLAANPQILDDERPYWRPQPPTVPAADKIISQIESLRRAVDAYRRVAAPKLQPPHDDNNIPF